MGLVPFSSLVMFAMYLPPTHPLGSTRSASRRDAAGNGLWIVRMIRATIGPPLGDSSRGGLRHLVEAAGSEGEVACVMHGDTPRDGHGA